MMHVSECSSRLTIRRGVFKGVVSFQAEKFHTMVVQSFLLELIYQHCILRIPLCRAVRRNLNRPQLGAHCAVIHFDPDADLPRVYLWGPKTSRPFGVALPPDCPTCGALAHWNVKKSKQGVHHQQNRKGKQGGKGMEGVEEEAVVVCAGRKCRYQIIVKKPSGLLDVDTDVQRWHESTLTLV